MEQRRYDLIDQTHLAIDAFKMLANLFLTRVTVVQQEVYRGLDHIQRIANLMCQSTGDLTEGGQSLFLNQFLLRLAQFLGLFQDSLFQFGI